MSRVSESLAGRLALVELTPLLLSELPSGEPKARHWLCGGYPDGGVLTHDGGVLLHDGGVLLHGAFPRWQMDYLALLTQRDLPSWGLAAKPQTTDRLVRMLAALHGSPWNASQVAQSLGLTYHTVNTYLDYLVGAFLVRRLPPYQANIRKRIVKRPKVYWRDTGLLHAVLGVPDVRALLVQPWVGASWEGYVIEQALGVLAAADRRCDAFYFRTSDQHELDLVLDFGDRRWAVEVRLTTAPSPGDMARLDRAAEMIGASRRFLVSQRRGTSGTPARLACDLPSFLDRLAG